MNTSDYKLYRGLLLTTLFIGVAVFYWGLGDVALMSFNEARRALPTREMFISGDWLLPRLNGELYLTKPPLLYWLTTTMAHLIGSANEWAVRLPSALAATAIAIASYRYALRAFGAWPALFTLQLLIANAGFALFARRAEIEMLLTALCCGALLAALHYVHAGGKRGWIRLSYLLLALAVLAKGPLAMFFVTLPLLVYAWLRPQPRLREVLRDPAGWAIFLLVGLSWYVAVTWRLGFDAWLTTIHKDMLNKVHGTTGEPWYSYVPWLLTDFFPAGLLLLLHPLATWRRWKLRDEHLALLLAAALPLLIFSSFSDKHAKYLLPIYPLLAILLGGRLGELLNSARAGLRKTLLAAGIVLPAMCAAYFAVVESRVFNYRVSAFPQFHSWLETATPYPLYAYKDLDERLIYYAQRNIKIVDQLAISKIRDAHQPALILVDHTDADAIRSLADCQLQQFKPYLKKRKSLVVLGIGSACNR